MLNTKTLSQVIKVFLLILILGTVLFQICVWHAMPNEFTLGSFFSASLDGNLKVMTEMTVSHKLLGFAVGMLFEAFTIAILWMLYRLFDRFSKGEYFSLSVVTLIKRAGFLYLIKEVIAPFHEALQSFIITMYNPVLEIKVSFSDHNFSNILVGLMLVVIASIMLEGVKLKQDANLTV